MQPPQCPPPSPSNSPSIRHMNSPEEELLSSLSGEPEIYRVSTQTPIVLPEDSPSSEQHDADAAEGSPLSSDDYPLLAGPVPTRTNVNLPVSQ